MSSIPPVSAIDHCWGREDALITLVEYGDFQCPYCRRAYPIVKALKEEMKDTLRVIFRNFPLTKIHPLSKPAAIAAEAAARQNKFWEMHDMIFENQRYLVSNSFHEFAGSLQLDMSTFEKDLMDPSLQEKVETDFINGLRSGVNATPTFFVNAEKYVGDWDGDNLSIFLQEQLLLLQ